MNFRLFIAATGLLSATVLADPPSGRTSAPAVATRPCPQLVERGHPAEAAGQPVPCAGMRKGRPGLGRPAPAAGTRPAVTRNPQVFGWELMTPHERAVYQRKMHEAKTEQERAAIRAEHHKEMLKRASEEGVTLPENPPPA